VTRLRPESLDAIVSLLARRAAAWPELAESHPELVGYFARQGAWHLVRAGKLPEAIDLLGRLLAFDERGHFVTPRQQTVALADGLAPLARYPRDRVADFDARVLASLLSVVQDRGIIRAGCRLLSRLPLEELDAAFSGGANPSSAVVYVLAECLARDVLDSDDRAGWQRLAEVAQDHESAIQYAAIYAFKYVGCERPDGLTVDLVRPFAVAGPYDRLAATTLLLFLALQGNDFPLRFDVPEFWEPVWAYNAEEIELLRGAMSFRGLVRAEDAEDDALAAPFHDAESRRLSLLAALGEGDVALRSLFEDYWRLTTRLDDLGRLRPVQLPERIRVEAIWLLLVSPLWEVSEAGSTLAAALASMDEEWAIRLTEWATWDDETSWWGALVALRLVADQTGNDEGLFAALRVQSRSESAQLRGNCANTIQTLVAGASRARQMALLTTFEEEIRLLVHGDDVWAVNEILILLESLGDAREAWAERWAVDAAPLIRLTPDWRDEEASNWGDYVTACRTAARDTES
jgi:hypothetical protein